MGLQAFHLEVMRHRWCAHNRGITRKRDDREWDIYEPGPVILTTRTHWKKDPSAELNALMSARRQDILQVHFRPESPAVFCHCAIGIVSRSPCRR